LKLQDMFSIYQVIEEIHYQRLLFLFYMCHFEQICQNYLEELFLC